MRSRLPRLAWIPEVGPFNGIELYYRGICPILIMIYVPAIIILMVRQQSPPGW